MGLLSHISNSASTVKKPEQAPEKKAGSGLLAKAQKASHKNFSSLFELAKAKKFSHCAVFSSVHGMMVITHAFGLDAQTIANSVSSKDFWKGTLSSSNVLNYSKSDNELYNFLQFFSFDLRSSIQHISFLKLNKENDFSVLMVFNTDENEINLNESLSDCIQINTITQNITETSKTKYFIYSLNYRELSLNSIKSIQLPEENIKNAVLKCIDEQIQSLLINAFPSPAVVHSNQSGKIKLALVNNISDEMLLQAHISLLLQDVFLNSSVKPELTYSGKTSASDSLSKFLEN